MRRAARLLRAQALDLYRLAESQVKRVVEAIVERATLLAEALRALKRGEVRRALDLVAVSVDQLKAQLMLIFGDGETLAGALAARHVLALLALFEPHAAGATGPALVHRLAEVRGLVRHRFTVEKMGAQAADVVAHRVSADLAVGKTPEQAAETARATLTATGPRAAVVARTETDRQYNDAQLVAIRELNAQSPNDEPYLKRIEETLDERNHPFSCVADGQTVPVDDPFRVSVAAVKAMATEMLKSASGVFWPDEGGFYVGMNLPAHHNERGRIIPWRASWGT